MVMMYNFKRKSMVLLPLVLLGAARGLHGSVTSVTGDTGSAQNGALTLSGGASGGAFDSTTSTVTLSFDYLSLPLTSASTGQIIVGGAAILHNYGGQNIFIGESSGNFSVSGSANTGCGNFTLNSLTNGSTNTAIGQGALANLTGGLGNVAIGTSVATGLIDGNNNILIGSGAGASYSSNESNNIIIGNGTSGAASEFSTIRIGGGQSACYVDGIYGAMTDTETSLPIYIDVFGKLGTMVSSRDFKNAICTIGNEASKVLQLRPVSFYLKEDPKKIRQYGLIAEEVVRVYPELVVRDEKGKPYAVKYHELPVLLLAELQRKESQVHELKKQLSKLEERVKRLERLSNK